MRYDGMLDNTNTSLQKSLYKSFDIIYQKYLNNMLNLDLADANNKIEFLTNVFKEFIMNLSASQVDVFA